MLIDAYKRPIQDLRISVTDRCNFRCTYCMPLDEYEWIDKKEILTFEEITRLARLFVQFGVEKIRLTGGEPLVRQDLAVLVKKLSALGGLEDLCLTTNGALLAEKIESLSQAGLRRVNISIDTLDAKKFKRMTKRGDLNKVLEGIFAAKKAGLAPIKLNAVIERGVNDDDILPLVEFSREHGFAMRFIEQLDVGEASVKERDDRKNCRALPAQRSGPGPGERAFVRLRICRWARRHRRDRFCDRALLFELYENSTDGGR